jgi:hypothetical protein
MKLFIWIGISNKVAIIEAGNNVAAVVKQQSEIEGSKLDSSWENIPTSDKAIHKKGDGYYIVSLNNKAQNKTLYVLISDQGEFYDANFSGTFEGLEQ